MGFTSQFLAGVAQLSADSGVGIYRPTGSYAADELAIVFGSIPANPDRLIAITDYIDSDDPTQSDSVIRVQFRTRGTTDIRTSKDVQDDLFDVFQNLPRQVVGGVTVTGCWRRSTAYMGADSNGRHEHTGNYDFRLHRPTPNRT